MRSATNPRLFAGAIVALLSLASCSRGPYADLQKAYLSPKPRSPKAIPIETMVLISPRHKGAHNYKNMIKLSLSPAGIHIAPAMPFMKSIEIPVTAISGCNKTCFGPEDWNANVLVSHPPVEVSFKNSVEVLNWCWERRIRAISAQEVRDWMYESRPLHAGAARGELESRANYDEALRQSCLGY